MPVHNCRANNRADWKLKNSAKVSAIQVERGCSGGLLPSVQPHILAVVSTAAGFIALQRDSGLLLFFPNF